MMFAVCDATVQWCKGCHKHSVVQDLPQFHWAKERAVRCAHGVPTCRTGSSFTMSCLAGFGPRRNFNQLFIQHPTSNTHRYGALEHG
jgi:hypothetical protein